MMTLNVLRFVLCGALFLSVLAQAATEPSASRVDSRLRYTTYNQDQVYRIRAKIGRAFFLEFAPGEEMEKWYSGDSKAWEVAKHGSVVAIKPTAEEPATNMIIVTSAGRTYVLDVELAEPAMYGVRFSYPKDEAAKVEARGVQQRLEAALNPETQTRRNYRYAGTGSEEIQPVMVFDNGRYTFFKFSERQSWPSVFAVAVDGQETLVSRTVRGNWIIIPQVARHWRMRAGKSVLCIRNDNYAPEGNDNPAETDTPAVFRHTVPGRENQR
jgi:type IV secretion system protein VirB9